MQIIKVEIPNECGVGVCENCKQSKPVRPVESFGHTGESRGWYNLCFSCFGPQVFWRENSNGLAMMSPASNNASSRTAGMPRQTSESKRDSKPVILSSSTSRRSR
jgi:hypothetical protein